MYSGELFKQIDPCEYWKQNGTNYPALFSCAQILLAIPASSVPSESLFSEVSFSSCLQKLFLVLIIF